MINDPCVPRIDVKFHHYAEAYSIHADAST